MECKSLYNTKIYKSKMPGILQEMIQDMGTRIFSGRGKEGGGPLYLAQYERFLLLRENRRRDVGF